MLTYCEPCPENMKTTCGAGFAATAGGEILAFAVRKRGDGFASVLDDECAAMRKGVAAKLAGEGNIGEIQLRMRMQMSGEIGEGVISGRFGLGGDRQELIRPWLARDDAARGASSRTTCALVPPMPSDVTPARRGDPLRRPIGELAVDEERTIFQLDVGIQMSESGGWRAIARARARGLS